MAAFAPTHAARAAAEVARPRLMPAFAPTHAGRAAAEVVKPH